MSGQLGSWAGIPESLNPPTNPLALASNVADYRSKMNALNQFTAQQAAGQAYLDSIDPNTGMPNTQKLAADLKSSKNPLVGMFAPQEQQSGLTTQTDLQQVAQSGIKTASDAFGLQSSYYGGGSSVFSGLLGQGLTGQEARQEAMGGLEQKGVPTGLAAQWVGQIPDGPDADNALLSLSRMTASQSEQASDLAQGKIVGTLDTGNAINPIQQGPAGEAQTIGAPIAKAPGPQIFTGPNQAQQQTPQIVSVAPSQVPQPFGATGGAQSNVPVVPVTGVGGKNSAVPNQLVPPGYNGTGASYQGGIPSPTQIAQMGNGQPQSAIPNAPPAATLPGGSVLVSPTGVITDLSPEQKDMGTTVEKEVQGVQAANNGYAQRQALLDSTTDNIRTAGTGPLSASIVQPVRATLAQLVGLDKDSAAAFDEAEKGTNAIIASDINSDMGYSTDFTKQIVKGMNAHMGNTTQGNLYVLASAKGVNESNNMVAQMLGNVGLPSGPGVMSNAGQMDGKGNFLYNQVQTQVTAKLNPMVPAFQQMDPANQRMFWGSMDAGDKKQFAYDINYYNMIKNHDASSPFGKSNYPQVLKEYGQNGWNGAASDATVASQ